MMMNAIGLSVARELSVESWFCWRRRNETPDAKRCEKIRATKITIIISYCDLYDQTQMHVPRGHSVIGLIWTNEHMGQILAAEEILSATVIFQPAHLPES